MGLELNDDQLNELSNLGNSATTETISAENSIEKKATNKAATPESFWPKRESENANTNTSTNTQQNTSTQSPHTNKDLNQNNSAKMNDCKDIKTVTKSITLATSMVAGTRTTNMEFGAEFDKVVGYYIQQVSLGGLTASQIKVGFSNSSRTVMDNTAVDHFTVSTGVKISDRFYKDEPIDIVGGSLDAHLETAATTGSALELQVVFQLRRKK